MTIRGHEVHDGMIHVQLDADAFMAFPIAQIERITDSGQDVFVPSEWKPANVTAEGVAARGKSGIRVGSRIATGGPAFGRDAARDARARAKRRAAPTVPDLAGMVAAAAAQETQPIEPGLRRAVPDAPNSKMRSLKVAGRADAFAASGAETGRTNRLGVAVNGEMKLMPPAQSGRGGVEVIRMKPSESAAQAAAADGTPLRSRTAPPPPPPAESGAGDGN
jgi:hypothetical protein